MLVPTGNGNGTGFSSTSNPNTRIHIILAAKKVTRDDLCIINDGAIQWVQRDSEDSKVPENCVLYWILLLCNGCELCLY